MVVQNGRIVSHFDFFFFLVAVPASGLSDLRVDIPDTLLRGQNAVFNCTFTLEDEKLYAIKWYRGTYEIFRYIPSDNPPLKTFPLLGYNVSIRLIFFRLLFARI